MTVMGGRLGFLAKRNPFSIFGIQKKEQKCIYFWRSLKLQMDFWFRGPKGIWKKVKIPKKCWTHRREKKWNVNCSRQCCYISKVFFWTIAQWLFCLCIYIYIYVTKSTGLDGRGSALISGRWWLQQAGQATSLWCWFWSCNQRPVCDIQIGWRLSQPLILHIESKFVDHKPGFGRKPWDSCCEDMW